VSYITLVELLDSPGATELAQVAGPEHLVVVPAALLIATINGADRSIWSVDEQAAADAAVATITSARTDADQLIDGYLRVRYALPLLTVPALLRKLARHITRYELHRYRVDAEHPIVRAYRDAVKLLEALSAGRVTLGAADPIAPDTSSSGGVEFTGRSAQFADSLRRI